MVAFQKRPVKIIETPDNPCHQPQYACDYAAMQTHIKVQKASKYAWATIFENVPVGGCIVAAPTYPLVRAFNPQYCASPSIEWHYSVDTCYQVSKAEECLF